jgi:hypothetical protein
MPHEFFLINDIAKSSSKQAISLEHAYDNNSVSGFMFCTYSTDTLVSVDMTDILDLFEMHDQVFVLKNLKYTSFMQPKKPYISSLLVEK